MGASGRGLDPVFLYYRVAYEEAFHRLRFGRCCFVHVTRLRPVLLAPVT